MSGRGFNQIAVFCLFFALSGCAQQILPPPAEPELGDDEQDSDQDNDSPDLPGPDDDDDDDSVDDTPPPSAFRQACSTNGANQSPTDHPFGPLEDVGLGLINTSNSLEEILEYGQLASACDDFADNPNDEYAKLRCGKWMFFYETFDTSGLPGSMIRYMVDNFPDQVGTGFSKMGMIPDPYSDEGYPLGFAPTETPDPDSLSYTCASCHFGRMPDGRYSVGYPNHQYDYGRQVLSLFLFPQLVNPLGTAEHDPAAVAKVQPMVDVFNQDLFVQLGFAWVGLGMLGTQLPEIGPEIERAYASWRPGTQDFMMAPTPIDDGVHTVHKIQPLWGIPSAELVEATGADGALLGWSGGTYDVPDFLRAFVDLGFGNGAHWSDKNLEPIAAYVQSLRTPPNLSPASSEEIEDGCYVFEDAGCLECHSGVGGGGLRVYSFDEVGTDHALESWMDADLDGEPSQDIPEPDFDITHGVKSPRLRGLYSFEKFLHNGSLDTLEQLLCLEPRPAGGPPPFSSEGHEFGCNLSSADRRALIAYLESH